MSGPTEQAAARVAEAIHGAILANRGANRWPLTHHEQQDAQRMAAAATEAAILALGLTEETKRYKVTRGAHRKVTERRLVGPWVSIEQDNQ